MSQEFKKTMLDQLCNMDLRTTRDVLGTMLVNCTPSQTTLTSSIINAMYNPISLFPNPQQVSQSSTNANAGEEGTDKSFVKAKKKKGKKKLGKDNKSSGSNSKSTFKSAEDESNDDITNEVPVSFGAKAKKLEDFKRAIKKRLRETTGSGRVVFRGKEEAETALRKRKNERRDRKLFRRLQDQNTADSIMVLGTDSDDNLRPQSSRKDLRHVQEDADSDGESFAAGGHIETATPLEVVDPEAVCELAESQSSARKKSKKSSKSGKKRQAKNATRTSRKYKKSDWHFSEDLSENIAEDDSNVEDESHTQQNLTDLGRLGNSKDSQRNMREPRSR